MIVARTANSGEFDVGSGIFDNDESCPKSFLKVILILGMTGDDGRLVTW